jgi:hypothetical protein
MATKLLGKSKAPPSKKPDAPKKLAQERLGRPSDYTVETALLICERLARGETLRQMCRDKTLPDRATVHRWLLRQKEFREHYLLARELQCDVICDEILEIADDASADITNDGEKQTPNWEAPQRSRLRVDARKWFCAKVSPKKYGDRVATELSGPNGSPVQIDSATVPLMPSEVEEKFAHLLDKMETDMGMPINLKATPESRVQAILDSGSPVPPELYYAVQKRMGETPGTDTRPVRARAGNDQ